MSCDLVHDQRLFKHIYYHSANIVTRDTGDLFTCKAEVRPTTYVLQRQGEETLWTRSSPVQALSLWIIKHSRHFVDTATCSNPLHATSSTWQLHLIQVNFIYSASVTVKIVSGCSGNSELDPKTSNTSKEKLPFNRKKARTRPGSHGPPWWSGHRAQEKMESRGEHSAASNTQIHSLLWKLKTGTEQLTGVRGQQVSVLRKDVGVHVGGEREREGEGRGGRNIRTNEPMNQDGERSLSLYQSDWQLRQKKKQLCTKRITRPSRGVI